LTGRALKKFPGLGLQLGLAVSISVRNQFSEFRLGGLDAQQSLPRLGVIKAAAIWSRGGIAGFGNALSLSGRPLSTMIRYENRLQPARFFPRRRHSWPGGGGLCGFLNPFGTT